MPKKKLEDDYNTKKKKNSVLIKMIRSLTKISRKKSDLVTQKS